MIVTWQPIPITRAQGFILHYIITYLPLSSKRQSLSITVPANTSSITITGLSPGVRYSVTVMGETGGGEGVPSDPMIAELPPTSGESKHMYLCIYVCVCVCVYMYLYICTCT